MRILALLLLCWSSAIGQQTPPANTGAAAQSNDQKARAAIAKMIETLGGQAYLNVQDSYSEGRYGRFHNETQVGGAKYYRYTRWPDADRWELTEQRDYVQLFVGDKYYDVTYKGYTEGNPAKDDGLRQALVRRHYSLDHVLREWINQPGTILLHQGLTLAESKMAEKVTVINSKNEAVTIMISQDAHLPIKKVFTIRDPQYKELDEEAEIYDNWKMVQGVNTPYSTLATHNGQVLRQQYILTISYNTNPPPAYFTPVLVKHTDQQGKDKRNKK